MRKKGKLEGELFAFKLIFDSVALDRSRFHFKDPMAEIEYGLVFPIILRLKVIVL